MKAHKHKAHPISKKEHRAFTFANLLTLLRLMLIPIFYYIFEYHEHNEPIKLLSCIVFSSAMLTDFLDGYIARKMDQITFLGKVLDPMADKLMVSAALLLLMSQNLIPLALVLILIGRELVINSLKSISMQIGFHMPSSLAGKSKTMAQSVAIFFLLLGNLSFFPDQNISFGNLGLNLLYLAAALSLYSAGEYFYLFAKNIKNTAA